MHLVPRCAGAAAPDCACCASRAPAGAVVCPGLGGHEWLELRAFSTKEVLVGRRGYPPKFRHKTLDLVATGRPVAEVAAVLGISAKSIYTWRKQDRIDKGLLPGLDTRDQDELTAANKRIAELEAGLAIHRSARSRSS